MPTTRLIRSIPFWALVGGSVVAIAGGAYLLVSKLTLMASTLTDGTATGVEVYAGQIWAVLGAIILGAGLVGLALALTVAALRAIVAPATLAAVEVVEPPAWEEDVVITAPDATEAPAAPAADAGEEVATEVPTDAEAPRA